MDDESLLGGRYRLGARLGGGGMADVYRAVDTRLDREVAVKLFRSGTDDDGRRRFAEEARILGGLNHPGLVAVHDADAVRGELYLVMELVEGRTLADVSAAGPLPPDRVAELGRQLADVLAYVHGSGIVHRDVKPSNVLVSHEGRVYLTDFGISRLSDAVGRMTSSGVVVGTAGYMAPEQVRGVGVSYPADVYALGLVLLECATGQVEYPGSGAEAAVARLARSPHIPPELPEPLNRTLREMTADDPEERPTARRCADLLGGEATETIPVVPATQPATPEPTRVQPVPAAPARRRWPWAVAAGCAALLLVVLAVYLSLPQPATGPALPPVSGPPGVARLPDDLTNLERLVRG